MKKTLMVASLICFILMACDKYQTKMNLQNLQNSSNYQTSNQLDSVGILHNNILQSWDIISNYPYPNDFFSYVSNNYGISQSVLDSCGINQDENKVIINDSLISDLPLNTWSKDFVRNVFSDIMSKDEWSIDSMNIYITEKENIVIGQNLDNNNRIALLSMLSVYRHSATFWNDHPEIILTETQVVYRLNWVRTAIVDAVGGLIGGPIVAAAASAGDVVIQKLGGTTTVTITRP